MALRFKFFIATSETPEFSDRVHCSAPNLGGRIHRRPGTAFASDTGRSSCGAGAAQSAPFRPLPRVREMSKPRGLVQIQRARLVLLNDTPKNRPWMQSATAPLGFAG